jgi:hypothetical protein
MDTVNKAMSSIVGPSFNYANQIVDPGKLGVSNSDNINDLWNDIGGMAAYADTLIFGNNTLSSPWGKAQQKPLGNNYFIKSGTCGSKSVDACKNKDRYIYIRNIPTGKIPCLGDTGIKLPKGNDFRGLVPGLLEDIVDINPIALFNSLAGKGDIGDNCILRKENVGNYGPPSTMKAVTKCSPPEARMQCLPNLGSEKFTNMDKKKGKKHNICKTFFILFIIFLLFYIFIYKKKK